MIFCSTIPNTKIEENVGKLLLDININIIASIIPMDCIRYIFILNIKKPFANFAAISVTYRVRKLEGHNETKGVIDIIFYIQTSQL